MPRAWCAYHDLCVLLAIEPIPGHVLDRRLLLNELGRLLDLAADAGISTDDIVSKAVSR